MGSICTLLSQDVSISVGTDRLSSQLLTFRFVSPTLICHAPPTTGLFTVPAAAAAATTAATTHTSTTPFKNDSGLGVDDAEETSPHRMLILDRAADPDGRLAGAVLPNVTLVTFDSRLNTMAELAALIRAAKRAGGYRTVGFANHGPGSDGEWAWTIDTSVAVGPISGRKRAAKQRQQTKLAVTIVEPAITAMVQVLDAVIVEEGGVELMACRTAGPPLPLIKAALEEEYKAMFRGTIADEESLYFSTERLVAYARDLCPQMRRQRLISMSDVQGKLFASAVEQPSKGGSAAAAGAAAEPVIVPGSWGA
jgi:hypothetical protein